MPEKFDFSKSVINDNERNKAFNEQQESSKLLSITTLDSNDKINSLWDKIDQFRNLQILRSQESKAQGFPTTESQEKELWKLWKETEQELGIDLASLEVILQCEINKQAGINPIALREVEKEFLRFRGEYSDEQIIKVIQERQKDKVFSTAYLPLIAVIQRLSRGDFKGMTIVEIGVGHEGIEILSFFAAKGANVIAVDSGPMDTINFNKNLEQKVERIPGRWEDLSSLLKDRKVDIIYIHNMHPHPETGGKFNDDGNAFNQHVVKEMDTVLKKNGVLIGHRIVYDKGMPDPSFYKLKYDSVSFYSLDYNRVTRGKIYPERLAAIQEYENEPSIGDELAIFQKN